MKKQLAITLSLLFGLCVISAAAFAQNSKATADISTLVGCTIDNAASGETTPTMTCTDVFGGSPVAETNDNFVTIMSTPVKLSASQSLFVSPSLVTGLYTDTKTTGSGSTTASTAVAEGGVFLRAVLKDTGGNVIQIGSPVSACTNDILGCHNTGSGVYGVTLDSRVQTLNSLLSSCLTTSGPTVDCNTSEFVQLVLNTTSAHTFNFIFPNVGQGQYVMEIQAAVNSDASVTSGKGTSVAAAAFGLGSVTVETVRLVHDFSF